MSLASKVYLIHFNSHIGSKIVTMLCHFSAGQIMLDSNLSKNERLRFIAGAVCPSCQIHDRMVIDTSGDVRRCVECGFSDTRPVPVPDMLETRVSRTVRPPRSVETEPVRFLVEPLTE